MVKAVNAIVHKNMTSKEAFEVFKGHKK